MACLACSQLLTSQSELITPHSFSMSVPQVVELTTNSRLGVLNRALPVCSVDLVEVPLENFRYRLSALFAIPQQRLGRTHRLKIRDMTDRSASAAESHGRQGEILPSAQASRE